MCRVPTLSLINLFSFAVVESPFSVIGTGSWENVNSNNNKKEATKTMHGRKNRQAEERMKKTQENNKSNMIQNSREKRKKTMQHRHAMPSDNRIRNGSQLAIFKMTISAPSICAFLCCYCCLFHHFSSMFGFVSKLHFFFVQIIKCLCAVCSFRHLHASFNKNTFNSQIATQI